ncbi:hypothetical protein HYS28_03110 [Candidatus Uhrbacteria bacterium]|nr:hypothetical protein [Candidatus Uhrbacteria bacterium]
MRWLCFVVWLWCLGCSDPPPGETIDIVTGTYFGYLDEADLLPAVAITEDGSSLEVALYEEDAVLWAKATFRGEIVKGLIVLRGTEVDTIEGVTVDGTDLSCVYVASEVPLDVTGTFTADFTTLDLTVEKVGTVRMALEEPEAEDVVEEAA